jgi:preprotein translocase subunit SecD
VKKDLLWKSILIGLVTLGCLWSMFPLDKKINLGLDLRGGSHLVMEVQTGDAIRADRNDAHDFLVEKLKKEGIAAAGGEFPEDNAFTLNVPAESIREARTLAEDSLPGWSTDYSGTTLSLRMAGNLLRDREDKAVQQALQTISNRVDALGLAEPVILREGTSNRIVVQLPGVDDPERVKEIIKATAILELKLVDKGPAENREDLVQAYAGTVPSSVEIIGGKYTDESGRTVRNYYAVEKKSAVSGRDLKNARRSVDRYNQPAVEFSLNAAGAKKFAKVTGENINRRLAIVLDNQVMSAPNIKAQISDSGIIEGSFDLKEAEDLALVLRSGSLPASVLYLEERTVGPSLGQDSIEKGVKSGLLGLLLIALFVLVYYRMAGVNAVAALCLNVVILLGIMAYFRAVLTLPGIAGVILTIGMAVDANVLIFERIREEILLGKSVKAAIQLGFSRAMSAIVDSNLTTIISALFLFQFGTGPIKGFAVTLIIGLCASMFTAIFVSRFIFDFFFKYRERVETLSI